MTSSGTVTQTRLDYSSTNVTTSAWVQLVASLQASTDNISIFDSSGQAMELGIGAAGHEVVAFLIPPGGNGQMDFWIPQGSRISVKAVSATANTGELEINYFS